MQNETVARLLRRHAAILGVLAISSGIYLSGLDRAPVFVGGDEAHFASHAQSLATTGRDLNGTPVPLFF